jgi:hypothetical protein
MINQIHLQDAFPYSITDQSCRDLFSPVLSGLASPKSPPLGIPHEFLFCFMRGLMLEMKQVYSDYPAELPPKQKRLSNTFMAFGGLMSEAVQNLFDKRDSLDQLDFKTNHFIRLLSRWLMLLQPFTVLSRTAVEATAFLHPIFARIRERLAAWKIELFPENAENFSSGVALFLEIFSLYVDFVSSMLDGGEELRAASKYGWLIAATRQSKIQPSDIINFSEAIDEERPPNTDRAFLLRRGHSFTITDKFKANSNELETFVRKLAAPKEAPNVTALMTHLYATVKDTTRRKYDDTQLHLDRLILAALGKHLGLTTELFDISNRKLRDEKGIVNSHFVERAVETVYAL